jgi:hypothetical protein
LYVQIFNTMKKWAVIDVFSDSHLGPDSKYDYSNWRKTTQRRLADHYYLFQEFMLIQRSVLKSDLQCLVWLTVQVFNPACTG